MIRTDSQDLQYHSAALRHTRRNMNIAGGTAALFLTPKKTTADNIIISRSIADQEVQFIFQISVIARKKVKYHNTNDINNINPLEPSKEQPKLIETEEIQPARIAPRPW